MRALALVPLLLMSSGCLCGGGPPEGSCEGTWNGVDLTGAELDLTSRYTTLYPATCAEQSLKQYNLSWGEGKLRLDFSTTIGPIVLVPMEVTLPPTASTSVSYALDPSPAGTQGTFRMTITGVQARRTGSLSLTAGAESVSCTFDLALRTEGNRPDCGGSSGGGADFD